MINKRNIVSIFIYTGGGTLPGVLSCVPDKYCQSLVGPASYCRTWSTPSTCQGGDAYANCNVCASTTSAVTTTVATTTTTTKPTTTTTKTTIAATTTIMTIKPITTTTTITTVKPTIATTTTTTTTTAKPTIAVATTTTTTPSSKATNLVSIGTSVTSSCEAKPIVSTPLFLWVEGPQLYARSEFTAFYDVVSDYLQSNCANMRTTYLIVRMPHPYFPPQLQGDSMYWPPWTSPFYTEVLSKLPTTSFGPIKVLVYPYIYDSFSRGQWVQFANALNVTPAAGDSNTVYDGIYSFVSGWQAFINANQSSRVLIDGYIIDYEEVWTNTDPLFAVTLTATSLAPYVGKYPMVKAGVTIGYDDKKKINLFGAFMDYLFLQVYDLYYPFAGADATSSSVFQTYYNDPVGLASVILAKVLTPTITAPYALFPGKVQLMWSTQSMGSNCLYVLNTGLCGVNNEFNWSPAAFIQFVQLMMAATSIPLVGHGIYTFNFLQQSWLPITSRT